MKAKESYFSVDVETAGPIPGEYSLLALGCCSVAREKERFYVEVKPINKKADKNAIKAIGRPLRDFVAEGTSPRVAMERFRDWLDHVRGESIPIFVGFNAPFDWSFVNYYFIKYLGQNPFGFSAIDIKSYYSGLTGCSWADTHSSNIVSKLKLQLTHSHNALEDAIEQSTIFRTIRAQAVLRSRMKGP